MRILVISSTPWSENNSFGNTFSNFFEGIKDLKIASIYCRPGKPKNHLDMICYQITEKRLLQNLVDKSIQTGIEIDPEASCATDTEMPLRQLASSCRFQAFFWARDIIWRIGNWNSPELLQFVKEFDPDLIFQPIYYATHIDRIALLIQEIIQKPMIGYVSDDVYSLKQIRLSPLFWIDRFFRRRIIRKTINRCSLLYTITDTQKEEYQKCFSPPIKVLTKSERFDGEAPEYPNNNEIITLVYAGNLGENRWKSLALISEAIESLRKSGALFVMDVYSNTKLSKRKRKAFSKDGTRIHEPVSYEKILKIQLSADILVHVEGLDLKSRCAVHQSLSTKLVDYFSMGKCIFAVGKTDEASIAHLMYNDAAIVATDKKTVYEDLQMISNNPEIIQQYGKKAYRCGQMHHNKDIMKKMLISDMNAVSDERIEIDCAGRY